VVKDGGVVDLSHRFGDRLPTLRALLAAGALAEAEAAPREAAPDFPLEGPELAPVIPNPDKTICVGLNYRNHVAETGRTETAKPALFGRFAGSQVGHLQPLVKPKASDEFDYEGELAVVIGKEGRRIPAERAGVCGGLLLLQRGQRPRLAAPHQPVLRGQVVQRTTTDLMITSIPERITTVSTILPLLPGDVIVSGTPGGVGLKRNPPLFVRAGDVAEVEISGIGVLRNPVVAENEA